MYYLSFIFFIGAYYYNERYEKDVNKWLLILPFLLINTIKYGAGTDYFSYSKIYDILARGKIFDALFSISNVELGFRFVNVLASRLGLNFIVFSAIFMSVITYYTLKWIFEDSDNIYISILLFFTMFYLYWNLSVLRQGIVLTSLTYVYFSKRYRDNYKLKIVYTIIMFSFHKSALIVPIFYMIANLNWSKRKFIFLFAISPISRLIGLKQILDVLSSKFSVFTRLTRYVDYNSISYFSMPSLQRIFFILIFIIFYDQLQKNKKTKYLVNYALANLILYLYLPTSMVIGTRLTIFGYYTVILLIPAITEEIEFKYSKEVIFVSVILVSSVYLNNELEKQKRNSHYNKSIHRMNLETIFNKDITNYDNPYSVDYRIEKTNRELNENSEIFKRMKEPFNIVEVKDDDNYLVVKFYGEPNRGIINTNGEVVLGPVLEENISLYGPYFSTNFKNRLINNDTFYHISDIENPVNYNLVEPYAIENYIAKKALDSQEMILNETVNDSILSLDFLNMYEMKPVVKIEEYYLKNNPQYSYIRLATKFTSYYIVLYNNQPLVEKIFTNITPLNHLGIIRGVTHDGVDYINKDGEIIWFEKRN